VPYDAGCRVTVFLSNRSRIFFPRSLSFRRMWTRRVIWRRYHTNEVRIVIICRKAYIAPLACDKVLLILKLVALRIVVFGVDRFEDVFLDRLFHNELVH
jgi:hypothetical protein